METVEALSACSKKCGKEHKHHEDTTAHKRSEETPSFLMQPQDKFPVAGGETTTEMGPIGPWATGKVDYSPMGGLTGTRPVVDHYSITRYSDAEWRKHNEEVLCASANDLHRVNMAEFNSKRGLECISAAADRAQYLNTLRLGERAHEVLRWKTEVELALQEMNEEIKLLAQRRQQARQAGGALAIVNNISGECLNRRSMREGFDLQRDKVEEELIKEMALVKEVGGLIDRLLIQVNEQMSRNMAIKDRLEADWSNKLEAYQLEAINVNLKTVSNTILFKPAATRFPENQSTLLGWEMGTKELLTLAEAVKNQSCELRALLDGPILHDCVRDLKVQSDKVDVALARGIADAQQCIKAMETELEVVVRRNAECEKIILDLQHGIRGLDKAMKVAQSRLDYLQMRPGIENTRDRTQIGLVDEVRALAEMSSSLKAQLVEAEEALLNLINSRKIIEKELQNKLKTIDIDKNRCQVLRAHYPSATAITGF